MPSRRNAPTDCSARARASRCTLSKAVADTGGVCGVEASPHTTTGVRNTRHSLEAVMEHVEYCIEVMGIDHVGFGPDLVFGDHVGFHQLCLEAMDTGEVGAHEMVPYVQGVGEPP